MPSAGLRYQLASGKDQEGDGDADLTAGKERRLDPAQSRQHRQIPVPTPVPRRNNEHDDPGSGADPPTVHHEARPVEVHVGIPADPPAARARGSPVRGINAAPFPSVGSSKAAAARLGVLAAGGQRGPGRAPCLHDGRKRYGTAPVTGPRLVPVLLDFSVLTGDQLPRPHVGEIGTYGLRFYEADEYVDPDDPTLTTIAVGVEPRCGPYRSRSMGGREHGPLRWSSVVHGQGWAAGWTSLRPPPRTGEANLVELRGHLSTEFGSLASGWIRGVICGLWTVHSRRGVPVDEADRSTWRPAWGSITLTTVDEQPMVAHSDEWPKLPPGVSYTGLLAELDLDGVPDGNTGGARPRGDRG